MLDFFKTISDSDSKKMRQQQLEELKKSVAVIFKSYYERGFSYYFDIQSWIESELTGIEFAKVVQMASLNFQKK